MGYISRATSVVVAAVMLAGLVLLTAPSGASPRVDLGQPGPTLTGRFGYLTVSPTVVQAGQVLTAQWTITCAVGADTCPVKSFDWPSTFGNGSQFSRFKAVSGCRPTSYTCSVRVPEAWPTTPFSGDLGSNAGTRGSGGVSGTFVWDGGPCGCGWADYAVISKGSSLISGTVSDRNHQPVADVRIALSGRDSGTTTTSADGNYEFVVGPGSYAVTPTPVAGSKMMFRPGAKRVKLATGQMNRGNNFVVNGGVDVTLDLSSTHAPATGWAVLRGTVTVTKFGKPAAGVAVALWPKSDEDFSHAVSSGPRATLCSSSGRLWPGGSLADPSGPSTDVTTDSHGHYQFTIDVGTVPGVFSITAWARGANGSLEVGPGSSATTSFTIEGNSGDTASFVNGLQLLKTTRFAPLLSSDTMNDLSLLIEATNEATNSDFSGLAYAPINNGAAFLIYAAGQPPAVDSTGAVTAHPLDLVFEPDLYVGTAPLSNLGTALQQGQVTRLPTYAQWVNGTPAPPFVGTSSPPRHSQVGSAAFQYFGWPYPNTKQLSGTCG